MVAAGINVRARDETLKDQLQNGSSGSQVTGSSQGQFGLAHALNLASRKSDRSVFDLAAEFFQLSRGRGHLSIQEYLQYGVYDRTRHDRDSRQRFLTNRLHWPITRAVCDMTWQASTEDKWLCSHILSRSAIEIPETLAIIDRGHRNYPDTRTIRTADQFREFTKTDGQLPFFGKENRGICSLGAFLVTAVDTDRVQIYGEGWLDHETFFNEYIGGTSYILQRQETNHDALAQYTGHLATIRLCILAGEQDVDIPFAVLKLPGGSNFTDSFWRSGNLACGLDPLNGTIQTLCEKDGCFVQEHDRHPRTGVALKGERVPMWDRVVELARCCASIFQPVRYQSMDIAVTPSGPRLIEVNTGGGFDLPQLATRTGFLTDGVIAHFRRFGYTGL
ncbi:MAG: hypothetical protein H6851_01700 [Geminicoccaceae bacterium]|nr:hypothetical protein [Geminicoccaceae bacterium]MCB9942325.1 hypothetical protein [Geminicoccaceae bacterium]